MMNWRRWPGELSVRPGRGWPGDSAGGAVFDEEGVYRYLLWRRWRERGPVVLFIMLNPSTADADRDDATVRACARHARRRRAGAMMIANLYALRATDPRRLRVHPDPVGPENDAHVAYAAMRADRVIVAWGDSGPRDVDTRADSLRNGPLAQARLLCLGVTRAGRPRHPLYLPTAARLGVYSRGNAVA